MERSHVRLGDVENFDDLSLVCRVHGQLKESSSFNNASNIKIIN